MSSPIKTCLSGSIKSSPLNRKYNGSDIQQEQQSKFRMNSHYTNNLVNDHVYKKDTETKQSIYNISNMDTTINNNHNTSSDNNHETNINDEKAIMPILKLKAGDNGIISPRERHDAYGIPIISGSKKHKIQLNVDSNQIKEVENWKEYNVINDDSCACMLI